MGFGMKEFSNLSCSRYCFDDCGKYSKTKSSITSCFLNYSVVILAAGNGSRLKSSTPKILQKVGGLAILDHVIKAAKGISQEIVSGKNDQEQDQGQESAIKLRPHKVVVVTKPDFAMNQLRYADGVEQVFQTSPKGTADAVQCGLKALQNPGIIRESNDTNVCNGDCRANDDCKADCSLESSENAWVFVLYADVPLAAPKTLAQLLKIANAQDKTGAVILAMNSENSKKLGNLEESEAGDGTIKAIIEAKDAADSVNSSKISSRKLLPLCNCGILFKKSLLDHFIDSVEPSPVTGETYITALIRVIHENGYKCCYYEADSRELSGANTFSELALLERNFQEITREKFMENGVKIIAPETVFFSHDTKIEQDVVINPYVIFGEGVSIKRGAIVGPFCVLEGSKIGAASIGPFARIRPESEILDDAKIGNFVEIKKSVISEGTKVNHLSYIGDSLVGSDTNIGAGTITCNYDGKNKHQTQIGREVFVGSNTALVAPVKIGDGATIGAGSVITENIPDQNLAVARGRQRNIEGWKNKQRNKKS